MHSRRGLFGASGSRFVSRRLEARRSLGSPARGRDRLRLYFLTGQRAVSLTDGADAVSSAEVTYSLASDWQGCAPESTAVRDANGDGYGDIAIGEWRRTVGNYEGRVLVLW